MKKSKILETYEQATGQSYKFQPLYVGDVYKNEFGTMGIVLQKDDGSYIYKKVNMHEHKLPEDKAGLYNSEFVANVIQDDKLMDEFIRIGIIEDDAQEVVDNDIVDKKDDVVNNDVVVIIEDNEPTVITKDECKKVATKKKGETVEEKETKQVKAKKVTAKEESKLNIYQKINLIRKAWSETDVEKEGKGRAGGGAKYDYYKPQQIIDFCLAQELKYNLYSRFSISGGICAYEILNLDNTDEFESISCPFDVPRKMAASEAQQNGAAITYYNRRLAMAMYKIEDNSKESVNVLDDADYTTVVDIPAPPIVPTAPTVPQVDKVDEVLKFGDGTTIVKTIEQNVQPEVASKPVSDSKIEDNKTIVPPQEIAKGIIVVGGNEPYVPKMVITPPSVEEVPFVPNTSTPPTPNVPTPPKMGSIESLY